MTSDWLILSAIFKPIEQLCWHFELATCRHHVRTSFIEKHGYFFCFGLKKVKLLSSRGILFRQIRKSCSYLKCFRLRKSCFWNSSRIHVTNVTVESFAKTNTGEWLAVFGGVTWEVSKLLLNKKYHWSTKQTYRKFADLTAPLQLNLQTKQIFLLRTLQFRFTGRWLFTVYIFSRYTDSRLVCTLFNNKEKKNFKRLSNYEKLNIHKHIVKEESK